MLRCEQLGGWLDGVATVYAHVVGRSTSAVQCMRGRLAARGVAGTPCAARACRAAPCPGSLCGAATHAQRGLAAALACCPSTLLCHIAHITATHTPPSGALLSLTLSPPPHPGLVVTPFLPGDSLLFATGALAALGKLNLGALMACYIVAATLGDAVNYASEWPGRCLGLGGQ